MKDEFRRTGPVMHLLLRSTQALITQVAQTAACNRHHRTLDQQLRRGLLLGTDRFHGDRFHVTHELLACMPGVRRAGVAVASGELQRLGLVACHRGELTVPNCAGLGATACSGCASDPQAYTQVMCWAVGSARHGGAQRPGLFAGALMREG